MRTNVTSNVVNMIGNYLLIQGHLGFPAMGIAGRGSGDCIWNRGCLHYEHLLPDPERQFCQHSLHYKRARPHHPGTAKNMAKIASSVFIEQVFMRTGFLLVSIMAARLGTSPTRRTRWP